MIDPSARLGNNVAIGANAVIEADVELGDNVVIGAGCFVGKKPASVVAPVSGPTSPFIMRFRSARIV